MDSENKKILVLHRMYTGIAFRNNQVEVELIKFLTTIQITVYDDD